jgi:acyl-CoA hydrolase
LRGRVTGAQEAARWIEDGMSGFTRADDARGGQTPHLLEQACAWHTRYRRTGSMRGSMLEA